MPKAPSPEKQQVEIEKKPQTPQEQLAAELLKRLEKPVQPPPIAETLEKAQQAMDQAVKAKTKVRHTWYCTDCGNAHIQIHDDGRHFNVDVLDGEFVGPGDTPLSAKERATMDNYAIPKVQNGTSHQPTRNQKTLSQVKGV